MVVREQDARRAAEQRVLHDLAQRDGGHVHPALGETPAAEEQTDVTETPETEGDSAKADEETADSTESEAAATPEAEK